MNPPLRPVLTAAAAGLAAAATTDAQAADLVAGLRSANPGERTAALQAAALQGAAAVRTVAPLLADTETEARRAGKRALTGIVHHVGRPNAPGAEPRAVEEELLAALRSLQPAQARRDVLWLLSEIGDDDTVKAAAGLLKDPELREDARCVLERIPGRKSLAALKDGLKQAPEAFKPALAESLRKRGERVDQWPSQRLKPVKATSVKAG